MKHKYINKSMTAGAAALLLCVLAVMPAFAAIDPPMPSDGSVPGAVFVADGESELSLEQTALVFEIPELLKDQYVSRQEFLAYDARMTATYTLYNPTDWTGMDLHKRAKCGIICISEVEKGYHNGKSQIQRRDEVANRQVCS